MENELKCVLKAKKSNIKLARNIAQIFFSQLDSSIGFLNEIKTIVSEAVTNSIIHGYNEDELMDVKRPEKKAEKKVVKKSKKEALIDEYIENMSNQLREEEDNIKTK